jgi:dTDP-4-amino-4,6-dideoxygalactose transaminase
VSLGYNFLPTDIQAAMLIEQLKKLDKFVSLRNKTAVHYTSKLKNVKGIILPVVEEGRRHSFSCYTVRITSKFGKRDDVLKRLNDNGVGARVYYPIPLHLQPVFIKLGYKFRKGDFPNAELVSKEVLSLPIFPTITKKEQDYVIEELIKAGG